MNAAPENSPPNVSQISPALEKHVGSHEFEDDRELGGIVTRRLITPAMECYQPGAGKFIHDRMPQFGRGARSVVKFELLLLELGKRTPNICILNLFSDIDTHTMDVKMLMKCILRLISTTRGAPVLLKLVPEHFKPTPAWNYPQQAPSVPEALSFVVVMLQANGRFSSSSIRNFASQRGGMGNIDSLPIPVFNDFQAQTVTIYCCGKIWALHVIEYNDDDDDNNNKNKQT